ncbi:hypothetical protein DVH05_017730 [Phytophthora capsici]|nr:hypothetical protein DVH05_017730 [Phytophthora capsici]
MKTLSTLVFLALAVQCSLAASERKLFRSGYDSPVNFSDLPSLTDAKTNKYGSEPSVPGVNPLSKSGILPSSDSVPSGGLGKDILPTELTTVAGGRSGLQSLSGVSRKVPSLPTSTTGGETQGLTDTTDSVSGLSDGLSLPSTSTSGGKQTYKSGVQSEDRSLNSPKKGLRTPQPKKDSKKRTIKKRGSGAAAKNSHKPNVKPTPKPDPEQSPFQHSVE